MPYSIKRLPTPFPLSCGAQKSISRVLSSIPVSYTHLNLLDIYCAVTSKTIPEAEKEFACCGYGQFKTAVGEAVVAELEPIQKRVRELEKNKDYLESIIKTNTERASHLASRTLNKVHKKLGFAPRV